MFKISQNNLLPLKPYWFECCLQIGLGNVISSYDVDLLALPILFGLINFLFPEK